jgi:hypothetical protein
MGRGEKWRIAGGGAVKRGGDQEGQMGADAGTGCGSSGVSGVKGLRPEVECSSNNSPAAAAAPYR